MKTTLPFDSLPRLLTLALLVATASCGGDDAGPCAAEDLRARLAAAAPGETITLDGTCTITGPITVPAGVVLDGDGATLAAPTDGRGLTLAPSTDASLPTTVRELVVESADGCAAIVASSDGTGAIVISDVEIRADTGVGIAVDGVTSARIERVTVTGPVTAETAASTMAPLPPFTCGSGDVATHGIVLVAVATATVADTTVTGFGRFGVLALDGGLTATDLEVRDNLGAGLEVWGGSATLARVESLGTSDGAGAIEAYGVVYGGGAMVDAEDLSVMGGAGYGVFADGASATHGRIVVANNGFAGVWVQNSDGFAVSAEGVGSEITGNGFAGVAILDSMGVTVSNALVNDTTEGIAVSGLGTVTGADGVHVRDSQVTLARLGLYDNPRVGAVLDLGGGATDTVSLTDVSVDATGSSLGVVAQNGMALDGWDDGVTRLGDTPENDAAFSGALEIAGRVGPPCLPPLDSLETSGIADLVGM